ncbi:MAG: DNA primase [Alphaproteobacteria bacterium]|nr:DNA primase [Alphaproteobacteria bacterium]
MRITPAFLDELRSRVPLSGIVGRRVKLTKKGRDYLGLCPFHNEKTPSFTVSEEKGFYHCFGCQAHGDIIDFVKELDGLSFPETIEKLAAEAGMEIPRDTPQERAREAQRKTLGAAVEAACTWFQDQLATANGAEARKYLESRALGAETIRRFRLGFAPNARAALKGAMMGQGFDEKLLVEAGLIIQPPEGDRATYDRFRGRLIFPIADRRGRVIAFGGRIMGDGEPKYLNSPETPLFHKGRTLYNLDQAAPAVRKGAELIVAEGYMDVIALVQAGFGGAVAPLGTAVTEDQIQALWRIMPEPILCLDGDDAGRRAALRAAERALPMLAPGQSLRFVLLPDGEDPDSLLRLAGTEAMRSALAAAEPLVELLWSAELSAAPLDTPERQADLKKRLYQRARQVGNATVRELYVNEFRRRLNGLFAVPERPQHGARPWARSRPSGPGLRAPHRVEILDFRHQQALLAAVINHPDLIADVGEDLGTATFDPPPLDKLRREILKTWHSGLDSKGLESHLRDSGLAETLDHVLARNVYVLAPFARPAASLEEVRYGWADAWRQFRRRYHAAELSVAERELAETMTGENWARVDALRQLIGEGEGDGTDLDGWDEGSGL